MEARKGRIYLTVIGSPDRPPDAGVVIDGVTVADALDLILVYRDGSVALEAKNLREWITPQSIETLALIGKALRHDALPVLICRKVTYDMCFFFKQVGGLAFQTHTQLFPADAEPRLRGVKHKDGLGFHDIRFGDEPSPALQRFISVTLPRELPAKLALFRGNSELLKYYAIEKELERDIPGARHRRTFGAFSTELRGPAEEP